MVKDHIVQLKKRKCEVINREISAIEANTRQEKKKLESTLNYMRLV